MDKPGAFTVTSMADWDHDKFTAEQRALFPGALYGDALTMRPNLMPTFEAALADGCEEAIHRIITANPYLLQYVTPNSGHHGTWAFSKQMIRMTAADGTKGLIPDFLVVARNSLGFRWHIVELKRASIQFANAKGTAYSTDANQGIAQCHKYRAHFMDYIDAVRSCIKIPDLAVPETVILMIGDSTMETDAQRIARDEFDRSTPQMSVVSYDRMRRGLANDQRHHSSPDAD